MISAGPSPLVKYRMGMCRAEHEAKDNLCVNSNSEQNC